MEPIEPPGLERQGQDYVFRWPQLQAEVTVREITEGRDGPRAEIWARHTVAGHLHSSMLNLMSTSGKTTFIKALLARDGANNWSEMVEQVCVMATQTFRDGEPLRLLEPERRAEAGRFALEPLIPLGQPTLWFGDGKSGKSYMALAAARAIQLGQPMAGGHTEEMTVAYLDWEWDIEEHQDRLLRLGGDVTLFYRRCQGSLVQTFRQIERALAKHSVDLAIVDSLGLACGGDPSDADLVLRFFGALRYLAKTTLVIHHVPKDSNHPYGSVYVKNSARSAWYVVRSMLPEAGGFTCAFQHYAVNSGPLLRPLGYRLSFDETAYTTTIASTDPKRVAELTEGMSVRERVYQALEAGVWKTTAQISSEIGKPEDQVKTRLTEMKHAGHAVNNERGGWTLASRREDSP